MLTRFTVNITQPPQGGSLALTTEFTKAYLMFLENELKANTSRRTLRRCKLDAMGAPAYQVTMILAT